jgi:hypothetical protein
MVKIRTNTSSEIRRIPNQAANPQFGNQALTQSIQQFGKTVGGIGNDILEAETTARDQDWAFQKTLEQRKNMEAEMERYQVQNGYKDLGKHMEKYTTDLAREAEKDAPSRRAKGMYENSIRPTMLSNISMAAKQERVKRIESIRSNYLTQAESLAEEVAVNGNEYEALTKMNEYSEAMRLATKNQVFSTEEWKAQDKRTRSLISVGLLNNLAKNNPARGLALLKAAVTGKKGIANITEGQKSMEVEPELAMQLMGYTPEMVEKVTLPNGRVPIDLNKKVVEDLQRFGDDQLGTTLFREPLTSGEYNTWINRFESAVEQNLKKNGRNFGDRLKQASAAADKGDVESTRIEVEAALKESSLLPGDDLAKNRRSMVLQSQNVYAKYMQNLSSRPIQEIDGAVVQSEAAIRSDIEKMRKEHGLTPAFAEDIAQSLISRTQKSAQQLKRQYRDDPMSVVMDNDASQKMGNAGSAEERQVVRKELIEKQVSLGVTKPRVTTQAQAGELAANLTSALGQGREVAALQFEGLQNEFGSDFTQAMNEISNQDGIPDEIGLIGFTKTPNSRADVLDSIAGKVEIKKGFDGIDESERELNLQVRSTYPEIDRAFSAGSVSSLNQKTTNGVYELVKLGAMKRMDKQKMSMDDAIEASYKSVVASNFHISDIDTGNLTSNVLIPIQNDEGRPNRPEYVEGFMESHQNAEGLKELGLSEAIAKAQGVAPEDSQLERLAREGQWVNDGPGAVIFVYRDPRRIDPIRFESTRRSIQEISEKPNLRTQVKMGDAPPTALPKPPSKAFRGGGRNL